MIYLDAAATSSIKPQPVIGAVVNALRSGVGNCGRGVNEASLKSARIVAETRSKAAEFFNFPKPECIVFTSNATDSLNIAIKGLIKAGSKVVTSQSEHNSVLRPLFFLKNNGVNVCFSPLCSDGVIDYEQLEQHILQDSDFLVLTIASNVTGNLTDLKKVGQILKSVEKKTGKRPIFIADASQAAGSIKINAQNFDGNNSKIDVLCCPGHKSLLAPQGTGLLCVMPNIKIKGQKQGGTGFDSFNLEQPEKMPALLEAGTLNTHGIAGLNAAFDFINHLGIENITLHEQVLSQRFYNGIKKLNERKNAKQIMLYGDFSHNKSGLLCKRAPIISLNIDDLDAAEVSDILSYDFEIATRAGAHCAPMVHQFFKTENQGMVRFSFNYFTTADDIDKALAALEIISAEK